MPETARALPRYPIESVDSALKLLRLVAIERTVTVSAAAEYLEVAPSTAHRLLAMLEYHRVIEQRPGSKAYVLGPWLIDLALTRLREVDIDAVARPHLERLVERVGETAHVVALQGSEVVFMQCVECAATVRATARTGQRLPAHCTAGGKAQLAVLGAARVLELYPDEELGGLTPRSTHSRAALLRELGRIRAAGYAGNRAESEEDVHAVAAAIIDGAGTLRGAITVAGPPARMKPAAMKSIADEVVATTAAIGADL